MKYFSFGLKLSLGYFAGGIFTKGYITMRKKTHKGHTSDLGKKWERNLLHANERESVRKACAPFQLFHLIHNGFIQEEVVHGGTKVFLLSLVRKLMNYALAA